MASIPVLLETPAFSHYAVAWSPFHNNRIALASAANYGLVGNGRLHVGSLVPPAIQLDKVYNTQDGLYDIAWSELHENQIVTASGDGSLKLWDILLNVSFSIMICRARWVERCVQGLGLTYSSLA